MSKTTRALRGGPRSATVSLVAASDPPAGKGSARHGWSAGKSGAVEGTLQLDLPLVLTQVPAQRAGCRRRLTAALEQRHAIALIFHEGCPMLVVANALRPPGAPPAASS